MKLIETIYLGCEDTGEIAETHNSHTIRFCNSTAWAHGTLISYICSTLAKCQLLYEEGSLNKPSKISVIWPFDIDAKRKPADVETGYERVVWYFRNLKIPTNGIIVSFYVNQNVRSWTSDPWRVMSLWPTKKQWDPTGDYITIQKAEPLAGGKVRRIKDRLPPFEEKTLQLAENYGYDVKYVSYLTPFDELYELLLGSSCHFSYLGSTYFFAGLVGTPTVGWGEAVQYDHITYYTRKDAQRLPASISTPRWGRLASNVGRILRYVEDEGGVMNKPVDYTTHVNDERDLEKIFEKIMS
jgi:hypothetical protein